VSGTNRGGGRIVLCDVDAQARRAFARALVKAGYDAIEFSSGTAALEYAHAQRPDAVVIDLDAGDMFGYALCSELRLRYGTNLPIVFISADRTDPRDRVAGLLIGADEYLAKPVAGEELVLRIRRLLELAESASPQVESVLREELTARELEVLSLLAAGLDEFAIAQRLVISTKTVATHIQRILPKLGVHSRAQAVACAYREGLLRPRVALEHGGGA
jgi:DNA-binding NarL/FixJ family response regulator